MAREILRGLPVSGGVVEGRPFVIERPEDCANVGEGDVIVLPTSDPRYALGVLRAAGMVCEEGGRLSHVCVVSVEMGIPCITQVENARKLLRNATWVRLDGDRGVIDDLSP